MALAASVNTLMQSPVPKLPIPPSPKIPVVDRHHYSSSGGDYHSSYGGGYSHGSSQHKGSHSIALSALTLLAFLFFLNILQNCLQEHMDSMSPQVVVVTRLKAAREAEKRKGDDGILVNTSSVVTDGSVDLVDDISDVESRLEESAVTGGIKEEQEKPNKYFVKLVSRDPSKEIVDDEY